MQWTAKIIKHKGESRIAVFFEKDTDLIAIIKQIDGAKWSQQLITWHVPDTQENRLRFELSQVTEFLPNAEGIKAIENFKRWLRSKRYSENTQKTYCEALKSFLVFYRGENVNQITVCYDSKN